MGKGKEKQKKKPGVPGSGGAGAGAGGQGGGGGGQPDGPVRFRWDFDLPTEGADKNWKGQPIWAKIDRDAIYVESSLGSLGRVPAENAEEILRYSREHKGRLHGEILAVNSPRSIRIELVLV